MCRSAARDPRAGPADTRTAGSRWSGRSPGSGVRRVGLDAAADGADHAREVRPVVAAARRPLLPGLPERGDQLVVVAGHRLGGHCTGARCFSDRQVAAARHHVPQKLVSLGPQSLDEGLLAVLDPVHPAAHRVVTDTGASLLLPPCLLARRLLPYGRGAGRVRVDVRQPPVEEFLVVHHVAEDQQGVTVLQQLPAAYRPDLAARRVPLQQRAVPGVVGDPPLAELQVQDAVQPADPALWIGGEHDVRLVVRRDAADRVLVALQYVDALLPRRRGHLQLRRSHATLTSALSCGFRACLPESADCASG